MQNSDDASTATSRAWRSEQQEQIDAFIATAALWRRKDRVKGPAARRKRRDEQSIVTPLARTSRLRARDRREAHRVVARTHTLDKVPGELLGRRRSDRPRARLGVAATWLAVTWWNSSTDHAAWSESASSSGILGTQECRSNCHQGHSRRLIRQDLEGSVESAEAARRNNRSGRRRSAIGRVLHRRARA